jgi:hypothetical protein
MNVDDVEPLIKICLLCKKRAEKMDKCKICKEKFRTKSYYCSKACQESDWPQHKLQHKNFAARVELDGNEAGLKLSISQIQLVDRNGTTPLMINSFIGNVNEVTKLLLAEDTDVTAVDKQGLSVLDYALYRGRQKF